MTVTSRSYSYSSPSYAAFYSGQNQLAYNMAAQGPRVTGILDPEAAAFADYIAKPLGNTGLKSLGFGAAGMGMDVALQSGAYRNDPRYQAWHTANYGSATPNTGTNLPAGMSNEAGYLPANAGQPSSMGASPYSGQLMGAPTGSATANPYSSGGGTQSFGSGQMANEGGYLPGGGGPTPGGLLGGFGGLGGLTGSGGLLGMNNPYGGSVSSYYGLGGYGQGGSVNASQSVSGPSAQQMGIYSSEYNNALQRNDQNYQNILGAYSGLGSQVLGAGELARQRYGELGQQVQGTIAGVGSAQAQAIRDSYTQQRGGATQALTNAGLGNTTVTSSVQRGLGLDEAKAQNALAGQVAQLRAGYQSQLGGAGIGASQQAAQQYAGLGGQYLGVLGGYRTPYPNWPPNSSQSASVAASRGTGTGAGGGSSGSPVRYDAPVQGLNYGGGGGGYSSSYGNYARPQVSLAQQIAMQQLGANAPRYGGTQMPGGDALRPFTPYPTDRTPQDFSLDAQFGRGTYGDYNVAGPQQTYNSGALMGSQAAGGYRYSTPGTPGNPGNTSYSATNSDNPFGNPFTDYPMTQGDYYSSIFGGGDYSY